MRAAARHSPGIRRAREEFSRMRNLKIWSLLREPRAEQFAVIRSTATAFFCLAEGRNRTSTELFRLRHMQKCERPRSASTMPDLHCLQAAYRGTTLGALACWGRTRDESTRN